jgi:hypothetical protein
MAQLMPKNIARFEQLMYTSLIVTWLVAILGIDRLHTPLRLSWILGSTAAEFLSYALAHLARRTAAPKLAAMVPARLAHPANTLAACRDRPSLGRERVELHPLAATLYSLPPTF